MLREQRPGRTTGGFNEGLGIQERIIGNDIQCWFFGCDSDLNSISGDSCTELTGSVKDINGNKYPAFTTLFIVAGRVSENLVGIDDNANYKQQSAEKCLQTAFENSLLMTSLFLTGQEKTATIVYNSVTYSGTYSPATACMPSALLAASLAAECKPKKTGNVIETGEISL